MNGTIAMFLKAKAIVRLHKDHKNRLEVLQLPGKIFASSCKCRGIMAQISNDAFCCEDVTFIVDIENMRPGERLHPDNSNFHPCNTASLRGHTYHPLNCSGSQHGL
ncbi:hypothetical protein AALC17_18590 [Oscillospiraceae bacterium 38-13]